MVTDITMEDILGMGPVEDDDVRILMFYGPTCGPCKATMPFYEQTASYYVNKTNHIKFYRINAWEPEEQKNYCYNVMQIAGVPHFKIFYKGEEILDRSGGGDAVALKKFVHDAIDEVFKRFQERI